VIAAGRTKSSTLAFRDPKNVVKSVFKKIHDGKTTSDWGIVPSIPAAGSLSVINELATKGKFGNDVVLENLPRRSPKQGLAPLLQLSDFQNLYSQYKNMVIETVLKIV